LREGETLSGFVAASVRAQVRQRQLQDEFIKRGLASLEESPAGPMRVLHSPRSPWRETATAKLEQAKAHFRRP
jgi:hypothetical protein